MFHFTRNLCLLSSVVRISLVTVHRFDSWASIFLVGTLKTSVVHRDTLVELIKWATFLLYLFFVFNTNAFRCSLRISLNIAHCVKKPYKLKQENQLFGNVTVGQINLILFQGNSIPSIVEYINYCISFPEVNWHLLHKQWRLNLQKIFGSNNYLHNYTQRKKICMYLLRLWFYMLNEPNTKLCNSVLVNNDE